MSEITTPPSPQSILERRPDTGSRRIRILRQESTVPSGVFDASTPPPADDSEVIFDDSLAPSGTWWSRLLNRLVGDGLLTVVCVNDPSLGLRHDLGADDEDVAVVKPGVDASAVPISSPGSMPARRGISRLL